MLIFVCKIIIVFIFISISISISFFVIIFLFLFIYVYIYVCVYMYIYIYIYICQCRAYTDVHAIALYIGGLFETMQFWATCGFRTSAQDVEPPHMYVLLVRAL